MIEASGCVAVVFILKEIATMKINNILATKGNQVNTIRPEQTVKEVVELLATLNIGVLVVTDADDKLLGIISERDVVRELARGGDTLSKPVRQVMTQHVITGSPQDDLRSVLQTMVQKNFRHLPIVENGKLVGLIAIRDAVKAQLNEYQGEIDTLQTQVTKG